ncbi:uncharacterized protein LOC116179498 [Photinus pyralis]|uniref:uncharacterized protein LOC116179076 n=1 Tax=Photinus pyralis TaxID=7054 RepID=UPI00126708BF|nr:uncharacterized protein LOC116179076 [Photinus pyralis]XP_031355153.1 uncharacterized protein LOC116179498 [Photinus pyralis]
MDSKFDVVNESLLEDLLKNHLGSGAKITTVTRKSIPVGENFNSVLLRISIGYSIPTSTEEQKLSLVAKCLPDDGFLIKFSEDMKFFKREMLMYSSTLREMYSFGCLECVAPKPYAISTDPKPTILLEDLSTLDYRTASRDEGLDLNHCHFVLDRLAAFHATSVVLHEKNPRSMHVFDQALFADVDGMNAIMTTGFRELINTCKRWPELKKFTSKLTPLQEGFLGNLLAANKPSTNFNVLNHGDFWINNIMFLHDSNGHIEDVRFIDYQALYYSSPSIDLHYFLVLGPNFQTKHKATELLRHYHEKLIHYLLKLSAKTVPPKWDEFFEDFRSRAFYGVVTAAVTLAFMKAGNRPDSCIDSFLNSVGEEGFRYYAFNNSGYLKELTTLFTVYESLGVFQQNNI